jgi:hypothetical protein
VPKSNHDIRGSGDALAVLEQVYQRLVDAQAVELRVVGAVCSERVGELEKDRIAERDELLLRRLAKVMAWLREQR